MELVFFFKFYRWIKFRVPVRASLGISELFVWDKKRNPSIRLPWVIYQNFTNVIARNEPKFIKCKSEKQIWQKWLSTTKQHNEKQRNLWLTQCIVIHYAKHSKQIIMSSCLSPKNLQETALHPPCKVLATAFSKCENNPTSDHTTSENQSRQMEIIDRSSDPRPPNQCL